MNSKKPSLVQRAQGAINDAKRGQWIRFGIAAIIYTLFIAWVGNWWWIPLIFFIFDAYILKLIPWTWWKKSDNTAVRSTMSWVDAILYALIAVYFINNYLFQNYQIPTSSLEKSLLVGDYLFVSKATYGPRIPNTPLSLPLTQHTIPGLNCKSYIEQPQWEYRRLKGIRDVERNDIVVFNYPGGDTVLINRQNEDYNSIVYALAAYSEDYKHTLTPDHTPTFEEHQRLMNHGRTIIKRSPHMYGEMTYRPVDRRENYVKRCIGMPGDTIALIKGQVYINGAQAHNPEKMQMNYFIQTDGTTFTLEALRRMDISLDDQRMLTDINAIHSLGFTADSTGNVGRVYNFPLTQANLSTITKLPFVRKVLPEPELYIAPMFPLAYSNRWTRDDYGPLWIPQRGATIELTEDNVLRYERAIVNYEGNTLEWRDNRAILNGTEAHTYTFKMNYYFMMGDNRHNSADSRSWGFVPEDHVVGTPVFVWLSIDKDRDWFDGHIRWHRLFTWVKNIK